MGVAEIRGKISETGANLSERMEDLLTSDTFGCMRYVPPDRALLPFLSEACSSNGGAFSIPSSIAAVHYAFWPYLRTQNASPCEPDIMIGIETDDRVIHLVLVEAKYYSGISSDEDESPAPNDQLARELDNLGSVTPQQLGWTPQMTVGSRRLLFVTQDMGMPRTLMAQSLSEYRRKRGKDAEIFWITWRVLPSVLERSLKQELQPEHVAVLDDLLKLLERKGLVMFRGVDPIATRHTLPRFYRSAPVEYGWPGISESAIDYEYEVLT